MSASKFLGFDHIDTRVPSLARVEKFYDTLLPLLGLVRKGKAFVDAQGEWSYPQEGAPYNAVEYYSEPPPGEASFFIGIIEHKETQPTLTRISFRVERATLEGWIDKLREIGAQNIEPSANMDVYAAIFFEDPGGTKLELVSRKPK